ncbi:RluA family pseudouridine synthase [Ligilactobacillus saerimneri]|uniref:RluA family pseudouridine synthase n=1 Tax=Ligilactobacillus saerimneri TaxID=228229 RepID=UPI0024B1D832|nr:RluA family pseudouridine synthase [Ligilactobacillus saerimneri]MDI9206492.1 RluA family pseudouridine synthase [Ligilactobacillus saerimneri]
MDLQWEYQGEVPMKLKTFLKEQQLSRRLLSTIRNDVEGTILVNGQSSRKIDKLFTGDQVHVILPPEQISTNIVPSFVPIQVVYEDRDFLVVNKPGHLASIPSAVHPDDSLVSRVWGYYLLRGYEQQGIVPHIVTRLDRDTSGLVLFAKYRLAHAAVAQQLTAHTLLKHYYAIIAGDDWETNFVVAQPIGPDPDNVYKRQVRSDGKLAYSHFTRLKVSNGNSLYEVDLKTGRTHQIRVHAAFMGHPLIGDRLYGGPQGVGLERQALHCHYLQFWQPFSHKQVVVNTPLPSELAQLLKLK